MIRRRSERWRARRWSKSLLHCIQRGRPESDGTIVMSFVDALYSTEREDRLGAFERGPHASLTNIGTENVCPPSVDRTTHALRRFAVSGHRPARDRQWRDAGDLQRGERRPAEVLCRANRGQKDVTDVVPVRDQRERLLGVASRGLEVGARLLEIGEREIHEQLR